MARQPRRLMRQGVGDLPTRAHVEAYVGPSGEPIFDGETLRIQDGATPGGVPLAPLVLAAAGSTTQRRLPDHLRLGTSIFPGDPADSLFKLYLDDCNQTFNRVALYSGANGIGPTIAPRTNAGNANLDLNLAGIGTGGIWFGNEAGALFAVVDDGSGRNAQHRLSVCGTPTGSNPKLMSTRGIEFEGLPGFPYIFRGPDNALSISVNNAADVIIETTKANQSLLLQTVGASFVKFGRVRFQDVIYNTGIQRVSPVSAGGTTTVDATKNTVLFLAGAAVSGQTVILPAAPGYGYTVTFCSNTSITSVTFQAADGATVLGAGTSVGSNTPVTLFYDASGIWLRRS